jgi:hypothetical protein
MLLGGAERARKWDRKFWWAWDRVQLCWGGWLAWYGIYGCSERPLTSAGMYAYASMFMCSAVCMKISCHQVMSWNQERVWFALLRKPIVVIPLLLKPLWKYGMSIMTFPSSLSSTTRMPGFSSSSRFKLYHPTRTISVSTVLEPSYLEI